MKQDIIKDFNLPPYIKGKSFAEASKMIQSKFKDREDITSKSTMKELLSRLKNAQEHVKQVEAQKKMAQMGQDQGMPQMQMPMEQPQMQQQMQIPQGEPNQFEEGGLMKNKGIGSYMNLATTAMDLGKDAFGNPNVTADTERRQSGSSALQGAAKGAQAGMMFGPWGAAVGGVVGGAAGLIGAGNTNDAIADAKRDEATYNMNMMNNQYSTGGSRNNPNDPYGIGELLSGSGDGTTGNVADYNGIPNNDMKMFNNDADSFSLDNKILEMDQFNNSMKMLPNSGGNFEFGEASNSTRNKAANSVANGFGEGDDGGSGEESGKSTALTDMARYVPALTDAYQLATMEKPKKERLAKLDMKADRNYMDERRMLNAIDQASNKNFAREASGGSLSRYADMSRLQDLNKMNATSNAYAGKVANDNSVNANADNFDSNVSQLNMATMHKEDENFARDIGAYNTNKSALISQLGKNVGGIGTEMSRDEMLKQLFDYKRSGQFIGNEKAMGGYKSELDNIYDYITKTYSKNAKRTKTKK